MSLGMIPLGAGKEREDEMTGRGLLHGRPRGASPAVPERVQAEHPSPALIDGI